MCVCVDKTKIILHGLHKELIFISTPLYTYLPSQRELELQRRLSEASDREYANRQENLRLERLAEQLHVQKKALDHREFDLENFGGDMSDDKMAELRER